MNTQHDEVWKAARWQNCMRDTLTVLADLKAQLPDVWQKAEVVGRWVWIEFDAPPAASVRETLSLMGFSYNATRRAWQHACGVFTRHTSGNPRWKYAVLPAAALESTTAPATAN